MILKCTSCKRCLQLKLRQVFFLHFLPRRNGSDVIFYIFGIPTHGNYPNQKENLSNVMFVWSEKNTVGDQWMCGSIRTPPVCTFIPWKSNSFLILIGTGGAKSEWVMVEGLQKYRKGGEGGDIGLKITLVPKVYKRDISFVGLFFLLWLFSSLKVKYSFRGYNTHK